MSTLNNIKVFRDTCNFCRNHPKLRANLQESVRTQKIILEEDHLPEFDKKKYEQPAELVLSKKRTFEAASAYKGKKVCVLNFASAVNPGGGVAYGATAQEECLCRCSSLYLNLDEPDAWEKFYHPHRNCRNILHNDDIIYTPSVTVFKTDTGSPVLMEEDDWYEVNVITCAAPDISEYSMKRYHMEDRIRKMSSEELASLYRKRWCRILDVAAAEDNQVLVLGAFGCGAFGNDPGFMALEIRKILNEYLFAFQTIEFAIPCGPKGSHNYDEFNEVIGKFIALKRFGKYIEVIKELVYADKISNTEYSFLYQELRGLFVPELCDPGLLAEEMEIASFFCNSSIGHGFDEERVLKAIDQTGYDASLKEFLKKSVRRRAEEN